MTIHLEGAMLDEVDVWFPNIPMVVKGVQCGVPGIKQYIPMYPNLSQFIPNISQMSHVSEGRSMWGTWHQTIHPYVSQCIPNISQIFAWWWRAFNVGNLASNHIPFYPNVSQIPINPNVSQMSPWWWRAFKVEYLALASNNCDCRS